MITEIFVWSLFAVLFVSWAAFCVWFDITFKEIIEDGNKTNARRKERKKMEWKEGEKELDDSDDIPDNSSENESLILSIPMFLTGATCLLSGALVLRGALL